MANFDIATLLKFDPPEFVCKNCARIFHRSEVVDFPFDTEWLKCSICGKQHSAESEFKKLRFGNIVDHSRKLASIADAMEQSLKDKKTPPLRILLSALLCAENFIHLTSYGLNHTMLGGLKLIAQAVDVRGLIANADDNLCSAINDYKEENPRLDLVAIRATKTYRQVKDQIPHQKLIIIDGLLAFAGSTNFTLQAWRNAREGLEHIEIITEIGKIQDLHDRLFSQHWCKLNPFSKVYPDDEIPF